MKGKLKFKNTILITLSTILLSIILQVGVSAQTNLITNGGFETGNFTGWTATNAAGAFEAWAACTNGQGFADTPTPLAAAPPVGLRDACQGVTTNPAGSMILFQQVTLPTLAQHTLYWKHRYQMNHVSYCNSAATCGVATYSVQILNTSNVVLQTLFIASTPANTSTNTGWIQSTVNLNPFTGQTIRIRFITNVTVALSGPGRLEVDDVILASRATTSAESGLSGIVKTASGTGISRADVTVTNTHGEPIASAMTNSFGAFKLANLSAGQTYIVNVRHGRYQFTPQIVFLTENIGDVQFTAQE
ncbi:MAG TPA: carboxypeptidase regulatory-like domain-containing protein [Pyrinomonadaceae bacterium]|nr:carboxypeptidase regulatory-like domain-containing protein [Pyrinomonadaceae bacterium]